MLKAILEKEYIKALFFLVLSVVGLVIAVTTQDETVKTLLGAPSFVGVILSASLWPF